MKRRIMLCLVLLVVLFGVCGNLSVSAAANPTWKANKVTNLTQTDAKISVKVTFGSKVKFSEGGFYIGTSKTNMHKNAYPDASKTNSTTTTFSFLMSKYQETLYPGTTYYYQTYVKAGGQVHKSPVYSFKTNGDKNTPVWGDTAPTTSLYDATLNASAKFGQKVKITKAGFYFGTSQNNLKKVTQISIKGASVQSFSTSFQLSDFGKSLKPGTAYYYQYFAVIGGKTYSSSVMSFKTKAADDYVETTVSDITKTNAVLTAKVSDPAWPKRTRCALQFGTSADNLKTVKTYTSGIASVTQECSFDLNGLGQMLEMDTVYYYRFAVKLGSYTGYTTIQSFRTESNATRLVFPLPTDQVWYASTYVGHGGSNKSAYSSVDITLKNGKSCAGYPVYSMADGVVWVDKYKGSNGQITIKYTSKLITTNGAEYTTWYATYAHMTNITVKKGDTVKAGQQIGKVGSVGKSSGPHLHLSIGSGNGGSSWYQEKYISKAISPYYLLGFVNSDGTSTSYLVRDMEGTGVTNQLINHKPTGK